MKLINALAKALVFAVVLASCSYGESYHCIDSPRQRYYLDSSTIKKVSVVNKPTFSLQYAKGNQIVDTIELVNIGSEKSVLKLLDYNYCYDDLKDYVEGSAFYFISSIDKKYKLTFNVLPVFITYYSNKQEAFPSYSLRSSQESMEVRWNNLEIALQIRSLESTTETNFYPSILLGSKTFNNIYQFPINDSSYIYLNKSTIAQIAIGKETWTNIN